MALEEKSKYSNTTFSIPEFGKFQEYNPSGRKPSMCSYRQEKPGLSSSSGGRKPQDHAATDSRYISDQIAQCDSDIEVFALMERLMDDFNVPSFLLLKTTNSTSHPRKFQFLLSNSSRSATDFLEQTALFDNICMLHDNDWQVTRSAVRYNFLNLLTSREFLKISQIRNCTVMDNGLAYLLPLDGDSDEQVLALFGSIGIADAGMVNELSQLVVMVANKLISLHSPKCAKSMQKISKRELECVQWTSEGKTSYEISVILCLSEHTINNYIAAVSRKLGAMNRTHLISLAFKNGLLSQ